MVPQSFCSLAALLYFKFHRFLPIFSPSKYDLLCIYMLKTTVLPPNLTKTSLEYNKFDSDKTKHGLRVLKVQGVHKVLHTFKILISQKPHMVETLDFRQ